MIKWVTKISAIFTIAVMISLSAGAVFAQKSEHYRSPLYSPKYYEPTVGTSNGMPDALKEIGIEQKLGERMPLDAIFTAADGKEVKLGDLLGSGRPAVLAFVYYECPMLCNEVLNGLTGSLKGISLDVGKDFDVIAISFDARENEKPGLAANKKAAYVERYGRPQSANGWHFLTGTQAEIDKAASAAGFKYKWDEKSKQFAHAGGVMVLTPSGELSRYLYGIDYGPRDLKFAIMESGDNKIGSASDKLVLYCFHYDPSTGKYGFAILNVIRLAAIATIIGMGAMGFVFWRRNKKMQGA